ncbi:DUF2971 domain-containing protein [Bacilliculturomica massiliensis]|uniref:DUF2971 domain-containing protein n=1 Tax=Bacilliculturomica massiliensis TaxID=1917867 RepID=UPI0010302E66|nr:DUF2971 domain-containing protein [Bacilliculturomica massiliensis]
MLYRENVFTSKMDPEVRERYSVCRRLLDTSIEDRRTADIYHYTSAEGFHNIISNRQFFLTDVAFLNDSTEMANIINIFHDVLEDLTDGQKLPADFAQVLEPLLDVDDFGYLLFGSEEPDFLRHFVLACSYEKDSLNLWNYYTGGQENDGGYNIAFAKDALIDSFTRLNAACYGEDMMLSHGRIIYDEQEKRHIIAQYLVGISAVWSAAGTEQKKLLLAAAKSTMEWLSIFYKHECFEGEQEYRVVLSLPNEKLPSYLKSRCGGKERLYKIRFTNNMFTPYVKLDFCPEDIKGVCMSPLCEKYTTEYRMRSGLDRALDPAGPAEMRDVLQYGVHEFLRINGYKLKASQIQRSEIPLRF